MSATVRTMEAGDVPEVVRLHEAAFPDNFMTTFGGKFLDAFYRELIVHTDGYGCVAVEGDRRLVGFCVGGVGAIQGIARGMLRGRPLSFAVPALLNVARSPARLARTGRLALGYLGGGSDAEGDAGEAHLLQIAVVEASRGSGVAERLVGDFLREMERRGATTVRLGVKDSNARAISFYQRMGFSEVKGGIYEIRLAASGVAP
ncbi:MAG: GNAT family N-acetyltransferase [Dehalococcoidia bacterium]